jgi:hypothetical protein
MPAPKVGRGWSDVPVQRPSSLAVTTHF